MKTLLQIEASVFSDNGQQLAERFVANWRKVKEASLAKARTEVDRLMLPEQAIA